MILRELESVVRGRIEQIKLSSRFCLTPLGFGSKRTDSQLLLAEAPLSGERRIIKISSPEQVDNVFNSYPIISRFFPTPEPRRETKRSFSYTFVEGVVLDRIVRSSPADALRLVGEIYESTTKLWQFTISPYNPQETVYDHRVETTKTLTRIKKQIERKFPFLFNCSLEINRIKYPSLDLLIEGFLNNFPEPRIAVFDSGDANSQNIIVEPDSSWQLIDIEKAGRYDPVYILARQIGQWLLYVEDPKHIFWKMNRDSWGVKIVYDPYRLPVVTSLIGLAKINLGSFIDKYEDRKNWEKRLGVYLFVFFARYAVLAESWILRRYGSFTSGPLLTEAVINSGEAIPPGDVKNRGRKTAKEKEERHKLGIVIVNYNTGDFLKRCLDSLEKTLLTGNLDAEIVLVDNNSQDNSLELAGIKERKVPIKLVRNRDNLGFARATNKGIVKTEADYYLLLNPDTEVLEGSLEKLVGFLDENPEVGIVGPLIKRPDGEVDGRCRRNLDELERFTGCQRPKLPEDFLLSTPVDTVSGACLMIRKSLIDQVGLLDESYFLGIEDVDWCYRVNRAINPQTGRNWQVYYYPQSVIIHAGGESRRKAKLRSFFELAKSMVIFAEKNIIPERPKWQRPLIKVVALFYGLTKAIKSLKYWENNEEKSIKN